MVALKFSKTCCRFHFLAFFIAPWDAVTRHLSSFNPMMFMSYSLNNQLSFLFILSFFLLSSTRFCFSLLDIVSLLGNNIGEKLINQVAKAWAEIKSFTVRCRKPLVSALLPHPLSLWSGFILRWVVQLLTTTKLNVASFTRVNYGAMPRHSRERGERSIGSKEDKYLRHAHPKP